MTEGQWKDVKTVSEIFQAVPEEKRERIRDILSGYRMGLSDGFRLCGGMEAAEQTQQFTHGVRPNA